MADISDAFKTPEKRKSDYVAAPLKRRSFFSSTNSLKEQLGVCKKDLLGCEDLTRLPYLYDETVLECLSARYDDNCIYTWAGPVLVAINPCRNLPGLYDTQIIQKIHAKALEGNDNQTPHVYTIAGLSHRRLTSQLGAINQAILVSGESGAGKTESARFLLSYLTSVEPQNSCDDALAVQKRIVASNPLLEAFGNASTLRNHNSSRFGKLIRLQYQADALRGAITETYLLEKTRVTHQPPQERNFHIFHQVLAGLKNGILNGLEDNAEISFRIIPEFPVGREINDCESLKNTINAFCKMTIGEDFQTKVFKVIVAIMHLGNIMFTLNKQKDSYVVSEDELCSQSLLTSSNLLGLSVESLKEVLTVKTISVVTGKTTTVYHKSCEREEQCAERRDAMMQLLYSRLFYNIVSAINEKTRSKSTLPCSYLAILDVYGFETFDENSLEQLCINYANERLQQEFTRRYLATEQRILMEEGFVDFPHLFMDNSKCVAALDSPISVFAILNEECQLKRAVNEDSTCQRVCNALQDTGVISAPPSPVHSAGFVVKHYAGPVNYNSKGLLHKNKDEVPVEILKLISTSNIDFIADLVSGIENKKSSANLAPSKKVRKITTLSKFKSSLDSLMKILTCCDLHYIRCIKPNMEGRPGHNDRAFLFNQLQSNGVLETVKISQAGYPIRMIYSEFSRRYRQKCPSNYNDKEKTFIVTLEILGDGGNGTPVVEKCRFGQTRIFLSESSFQKLEEVRVAHRHAAAIMIQKHIKRILCRKLYKATIASIRITQTQIRTWITRRHFKRIQKSVHIIQRNVRMWLVRKWYLNTKYSIIIIQKYVKGWLCRKAFKKLTQTDLLCSSRMSLSSTGYSSMIHSSLTDHSVSDTEDLRTHPYHFDARRRICEPEESGVETDTESLSGEGLKVGRISKIKKGRFISSNAGALQTDVSDTDLTEDRYRYKLRLKFLNRMKIKEIDATGGRIFQRKKVVTVSNPCPRVSALDMQRLRVATLKHLQDVTNVIRESKPSESLRIHLPFKNHYIYFKDGVLSYRQMPQISIKFHTKKTCLPYSTNLPSVEKCRGLMDAIR